jgi:WbqC-like protein family
MTGPADRGVLASGRAERPAGSVAGPVVSVHQPNFLPWLKLLDKILASDVYVAYDTVQYTKSEYHARQRVRTHTGPAWLSLPLRSIRGQRQLIGEMRLDDRQPFRARHLKTLRIGYARTPYFAEVHGLVEDVYSRGHERLADLSLDLIEAFCRYLGSPVRIVRASSLPHAGDNTQRLVQLVRAAAGTAGAPAAGMAPAGASAAGVAGAVHLTSTYGTERQYIDWPRVLRAGVAVHAQQFTHPRYQQAWPGFVADLAALDMLFCRGPDTARVLAAGRRFAPIPAGAGAPDPTPDGQVRQPCRGHS